MMRFYSNSFSFFIFCLALQAPLLFSVQLMQRTSSQLDLDNQLWNAVLADKGLREICGYIQKGAYLEHKNKLGYPFIIVVIQRGRADLIPLLIQKRVNLEVVDPEGYTAFWRAVLNANDRIMWDLLRGGACIDVPVKGITPHEYVQRSLNQNMLDFFNHPEVLFVLHANKLCRDWLGGLAGEQEMPVMQQEIEDLAKLKDGDFLLQAYLGLDGVALPSEALNTKSRNDFVFNEGGDGLSSSFDVGVVQATNINPMESVVDVPCKSNSSSVFILVLKLAYNTSALGIGFVLYVFDRKRDIINSDWFFKI